MAKFNMMTRSLASVRSTLGNAGKYYNSPAARKARRISTMVAKQSLTGSGAASILGGSALVGGLGGAAVDRDHRMRGAFRGAAIGALGGAGYRVGTNSAFIRSVGVPAMKRGAGALRGLSGWVGGS